MHAKRSRGELVVVRGDIRQTRHGLLVLPSLVAVPFGLCRVVLDRASRGVDVVVVGVEGGNLTRLRDLALRDGEVGLRFEDVDLGNATAVVDRWTGVVLALARACGHALAREAEQVSALTRRTAQENGFKGRKKEKDIGVGA